MDRQGRSPLHYAAMNNEPSTVETLLAGGISPDVQDKQGFAPLHLAAQHYAVAAPTGLARLIANYDVAQYFEDVAE